ncbi:MAG TPA: SIP domain-containing protein, partial [Acidimicrobiia bacterium]|nr:SIP domain-containing protein [Acidimicrobiia bacterium]
EELSLDEDAYWWIAGEREAIRAMRDVVIDRGASRERLSLNAHWRLRPTDPRRERPDTIS